MASKTNIQIQDLSVGVKSITLNYLEDQTLKEANISKVYLGDNLLWEATTVVEEQFEWAVYPSDFLMTEYTPTEDTVVASIEMAYTTLGTWGIGWCVALKTSATSMMVLSDYSGNTASEVSITADGTCAGLTKYIYKKTYAPTSRPTLLAGNTYYIGISNRYEDKKVLCSITNPKTSISVFSWAVPGSAASNVSSWSTTVKPYLKVTKA